MSHPFLSLQEGFVCLSELMLNVPVNSYGHVWMSPPFYGTFTKTKDVQNVLRL